MLQRFIPVPWRRVRLTSGLLAERQRTAIEVTLPAQLRQLERTGRLDAIDLSWKPEPGAEDRHIFWDSDIGKWAEAAAYAEALAPDRTRFAALEIIETKFAKAQAADGYISSYFLAKAPEKRWTNLRDNHEMYNIGHLIEAAVAWQETRQDQDGLFFQTMRRAADHLVATFGPGENQRRGYCGHPEIELALVRLFRATQHRPFLDLARFFVEERGAKPHLFATERGENGDATERFDYFQAHRPFREQRQAVGHAVRAVYLYAGAAAIAAECGDRDLADQCAALFEDILAGHQYITGGIGSAAQGERFTEAFDLPNDTAYNETCAGIGLLFFARELASIRMDARWFDAAERALFNNVLGGISLDGTRYNYANYLESMPGWHARRHLFSSARQPWFGCACCPPNLARFLISAGGFFYSADESTLCVHLYGANEAEMELGARMVRIRQETEYPWDGRIRLVLEMDAPHDFRLQLRIPSWCREPRWRLNGAEAQRAEPGRYLAIERRWQSGDVVELDLPMPVERIYSHPRVTANLGRVALQRGPVVYCFEQHDQAGGFSVVLPRDSKLDVAGRVEALGGVPTIAGEGAEVHLEPESLMGFNPPKLRRTRVTGIPYFARDNRGECPMRVWLPESHSDINGGPR